ncbi:M6 family metalloprotease domain-containing protein [Fibrella aquatilis]|uniref:M6 family metalloprotease domain-containing protein n=1 Tax=Fibrella aquatilis TaxID=2817059 RepID=A0A939G944_9BACT|nr:M6 family metalloprotease domain-containing protein [Fibrella aquatilis]MBO0933260.1 M6 family metalloprotease domain-containing protein [Fibrella aquatilis]
MQKHLNPVRTHGSELPLLPSVDEPCLLVPPSPELKEKLNKDLEKLRKRDSALSANLTFREEKSVGLDDGLIYPGTLFPLGTTASVASRAAADRAPLRGTVRVAVILVNFSDRAMAQPASHFNDLFFSIGAVPTGSVREYYREVTNNLVDIQGQVIGPVTLSHTMAYYAHGASGTGNAAPNARNMAQEAAQLANPLINFGNYDNDGDGFVDAFVVIHAGGGAEQSGSASEIWSHKWQLPSPFAADGKTIYAYLTVPENCRLGVCAHELGHLLFGFPDLYDGDYSSEGIGNWCLMSGGSWNGSTPGDRPAHPSAWCKVKQGWVTVVNQTTNAAVSLPDVKSSRRVHRLWKNGAAGTEYFLVENRQKTGFDDHLPQGGLLVWHIDDAVNGNTNEAHYQVALMQADGLRNLELNNNRGDAGDPFPGSANKRTFNASSTPNSNSYAGSGTCVAITDISDAAATMTARFQVRCKVILKEFKDKDKDKEIIKDHKDIIKDHKEIVKEQKEFVKDFHPDKPIKEKDKEKDIFEKPGDKFGDGKFGDGKFGDGKLGDQGGGGFGGGGGGFGAAAQADPMARLAAVEGRLNALEPFISQALRPDLTTGAYRQEDDQTTDGELDAATKNSLDTKVPDTITLNNKHTHPMKKLLIISQLHDAVAFALADVLHQQGQLQVDCLTDADLLTAPDWRVWLTTDTTHWQLTLADGRVFTNATTQAIYSRLTLLQPAPFANPADTHYAQAEWYALLAGWLQNLGTTRRLGALSPTTLAANTANPLLRLSQLAQAGLPVADMTASTQATTMGQPARPDSTPGVWQQEPLLNQYQSVLALGQTLTGSLASLFGEGVQQLQQQLDCELLQVYFTQTTRGDWKATNYQTVVQPDTPDDLLALAHYLTQQTLAPTPAPHALSPVRLTPAQP